MSDCHLETGNDHGELRPWGQQLILDLNGCPVNLITDTVNIKRWLSALMDSIEMTSYGEPLLHHFGHKQLETSGYSLVQLIETSNISAHFAENVGQVYIDIFSCKSFVSEKAIVVSLKWFQPTEYRAVNLSRGMFPSDSSTIQIKHGV